MAESEKEAALPPKEAFSDWYNELLWMAEIMDVRYPVKGLYVWYPFGFAIRRNTYSIIRKSLTTVDIGNTFSSTYPRKRVHEGSRTSKALRRSLLGHTGGKTLYIPLALRPTSETAIYPMYKNGSGRTLTSR